MSQVDNIQSEISKIQDKLYEKVVEIFNEKDLIWGDIEENLDECQTVDDKIGVILRWIQSQSADDEWKEELADELLEEHLDD